MHHGETELLRLTILLTVLSKWFAALLQYYCILFQMLFFLVLPLFLQLKFILFLKKIIAHAYPHALALDLLSVVASHVSE